MDVKALAGASHKPMDMAALAASTEAAKAAVVAEEAAKREAIAMGRLKAVYGDYAARVVAARRSNDSLGKSLKDGSYARATREMAKLTREAERFRREGELTARFGDRLGRALARSERPLGVAKKIAERGVAVGTGLYNRGMSNTVEQGRAEMEKNLLGREVAGIFKPISDETTRLTRKFRELLGGMSRGQQDTVLAGGLGVMGVLGAVGMARGGGLGKLALGGAAVAGGAASGMGAGDIAGLAGTAYTAKMALDAKRAADAARAGLSAGAGAMNMGALAKSAAPVAGAATSGAGRLALRSLRLGIAGEAIGHGIDINEGYDRRRKEGEERGSSFLKSTVSNAADKTMEYGLGHKWDLIKDTYKRTVGEKNPIDAIFPGKKSKDDDDAKRRVAMQGGGFQEVGSGYDQIAEGFGKVSGSDEAKKAEGEKTTAAVNSIAAMFAPVVAKLLEGGSHDMPSKGGS